MDKIVCKSIKGIDYYSIMERGRYKLNVLLGYDAFTMEIKKLLYLDKKKIHHSFTVGDTCFKGCSQNRNKRID